jgi:uncharacterized protein
LKMQGQRFYREELSISGLLSYEVKYESTDLFVLSKINYSDEIMREIIKLRKEIVAYSDKDNRFLTSLTPIAVKQDAPYIVRRMAVAAAKAGVGPMAGVAGGFAECIGRAVMKEEDRFVLENGGDIYAKLGKEIILKIFAGHSSPFKDIKIKVKREKPLGICTSSGRIGPSLSFGDADAACVISEDAFLADSCATAAANMIRQTEDIDKALEYIRGIEGLIGGIMIKDDKIGLWGEIEIV